MDGRRLSIGAVRACCGRHALLVLHEQGGGHFGLRVATGLAPALAADGAGEDDAAGGVLRGVAGLLRRLGREPRAVVVRGNARGVRLALRVASDGGGETDVACEPGLALLAARRLGLPIVLRDAGGDGGRGAEPDGGPPPDGIPEVYRETLAGLGLLGEG